jgi:hypothetical protein|tara:strand:+ start:73 stop:357 length:285 start_codon:yes stop_codon:yes gene_type:complete
MISSDPEEGSILDQVRFVASYTESCDDWVTIKKEVMKGLPSFLRKHFSTRDPITKEQNLNDFEKELISYYREITGVSLILRTLSERREMFGDLR